MHYLSQFVHAWLMFVTPLNFIDYKPTIKQQFLFSIIYSIGIALSREVYKFFPTPFGIHTIILIFLGIILFKNIVREFTWKKSVYTILILFIILLINDTLIFVPVMSMFDLSLEEVETSRTLTFMLTVVVTNLTLIIGLIVGYLKNKKNHQVTLSN